MMVDADQKVRDAIDEVGVDVMVRAASKWCITTHALCVVGSG
jgi:hypothetical protein